MFLFQLYQQQLLLLYLGCNFHSHFKSSQFDNFYAIHKLCDERSIYLLNLVKIVCCWICAAWFISTFEYTHTSPYSSVVRAQMRNLLFIIILLCICCFCSIFLFLFCFKFRRKNVCTMANVNEIREKRERARNILWVLNRHHTSKIGIMWSNLNSYLLVLCSFFFSLLWTHTDN